MRLGDDWYLVLLAILYSLCVVYARFNLRKTFTCDDASTATTEIIIGYNEDPVKETECDVSSGVMIRLVIYLQTPQIKKSMRL